MSQRRARLSVKPNLGPKARSGGSSKPSTPSVTAQATPSVTSQATPSVTAQATPSVTPQATETLTAKKVAAQTAVSNEASTVSISDGKHSDKSLSISVSAVESGREDQGTPAQTAGDKCSDTTTPVGTTFDLTSEKGAQSKINSAPEENNINDGITNESQTTDQTFQPKVTLVHEKFAVTTSRTETLVKQNVSVPDAVAGVSPAESICTAGKGSGKSSVERTSSSIQQPTRVRGRFARAKPNTVASKPRSKPQRQETLVTGSSTSDALQETDEVSKQLDTDATDQSKTSETTPSEKSAIDQSGSSKPATQTTSRLRRAPLKVQPTLGSRSKKAGGSKSEESQNLVTGRSQDIAQINTVTMVTDKIDGKETESEDFTTISPAAVVMGTENHTDADDTLTQEGESQYSEVLGDHQPNAAADREFNKTEFTQEVSLEKAGVSSPTKPAPTVRARSRFPKARPNLAEAGRPRIRHPSFSATDSEDELRARHPPPVQRIANLLTATSNPAQSAKQPDRGASMGQSISAARQESHTSALHKHLGRRPRRDTDRNEEVRQKRRKLLKLDVPVDRSKLTISDLIYLNPTSNPMKSSFDDYDPRRRRRERTDSVASSQNMDKDSNQDTENLDKGEEEKEEEEDEALPVPQVKIGPDGNIILNEASLTIETSPSKNPLSSDGDIIHERESFVTYASFKKRTHTRLWTEKETRKFFKALRSVGTDFSLMSNLFPKRTRAELKNKFKREEKQNRLLVDKAIRDRVHFDMSLFEPSSESEKEEEIKATKSKRGQKKVKGAESAESTEGKKTPAKEPSKQAKKKKAKRKKPRSQYYEGSSSEEEEEEEAVIEEEVENIEPRSDSPAVFESASQNTQAVPDNRNNAEMIELDDSDSHKTIAKPDSPHASEDETEVMERIRQPTRSGRQPKPVVSFSIEPPAAKVRKRAAGKNIAVDRAEGGQSPSRGQGQSQGRSSAAPGQFINISNLSNIGNVNVSQIQPGQLVFVTSNVGGDEAGDGSTLIHVYLVSPSGTLQGPGMQTGQIGAPVVSAASSSVEPGTSVLRTPPRSPAASTAPAPCHQDTQRINSQLRQHVPLEALSIGESQTRNNKCSSGTNEHQILPPVVQSGSNSSSNTFNSNTHGNTQLGKQTSAAMIFNSIEKNVQQTNSAWPVETNPQRTSNSNEGVSQMTYANNPLEAQMCDKSICPLGPMACEETEIHTAALNCGDTVTTSDTADNSILPNQVFDQLQVENCHLLSHHPSSENIACEVQIENS